MYTKKGKYYKYYSISIEQGEKTTTYIALEYGWNKEMGVPLFWMKIDDFPPIEYYIPLNKIDSLSIQEI